MAAADGGNPENALLIADQRQEVPELYRDAGLDEQVLDLLRARPAKGPQAIPFPAGPDHQGKLELLQVEVFTVLCPGGQLVPLPQLCPYGEATGLYLPRYCQFHRFPFLGGKGPHKDILYVSRHPNLREGQLKTGVLQDLAAPLFNMDEADLPQMPPVEFQEPAQNPALHGCGQLQEAPPGERELAPLPAHVLAADLLRLGLQLQFIFPGQIRQLHQAGHDLRVILLRQQGQQLLAHFIAQVDGLQVGFILDIGHAKKLAVADDLFLRHSEQRADKHAPLHGDAAQTVQSRPAQNAHEDSFRLIVTMVPQGDAVIPPRFREVLQQLVADLTGALLL